MRTIVYRLRREPQCITRSGIHIPTVEQELERLHGVPPGIERLRDFQRRRACVDIGAIARILMDAGFPVRLA